MASASGIRAGRAFVEIGGDEKRLVAALGRAEKRLRAFGAGVAKIGALGAAFGAAFAPLGIAAVKAASDAEEALSRFSAVFGRETGAAAAFADELAKRVGRSSLEIKDGLATFQSFFIGLGLGASEARKFAQQLTELSIDFASFNNLTDREAADRFLSALSGSGEVLDRFGVNIRQAALEQELLRQGIDKAWSAVTEQEKAIARLAIIMRTMGDQGAVGDATRTAGSFANQLKRLGAALRDITTAIGQALIPALRPIVTALNGIAASVRTLVTDFPVLTQAVFGTVAVIATAGIALLSLGAAAGLASLAIGGLATIIPIVTSPLAVFIAGTAALAAGFVALGVGIVRYLGLGTAAVQTLRAAVAGLAAEFGPAIGALRDAFLAGDLQAAAAVLLAQLRLEFEIGLQAVIGLTIQAGIAIVQAFQTALTTVRQLFDVTLSGIRGQIASLIDGLTGSNIGTAANLTLQAAITGLTAGGAQELQSIEDTLEALRKLSETVGDSQVEDARKKLEAAIRAAEEARRTAAKNANDFILPNIDALDEQIRKVEALGFFGGARIGDTFGGDSIARQQLDQAKNTAKNTAQTAEAVARLEARLTFA